MELRRYRLREDTREPFIRLFDSEFIESQERVGITVIGQFRNPDRPNEFVWLRGFESMQSRRRALYSFYNGEVWATHGPEANAMMLEFDNVLLLNPLIPESGFDLAGLHRRPTGAAFHPPPILVTIFPLTAPAPASVIHFFELERDPYIDHLATLLTDPSENTFPRLPVRTDTPVLVSFDVLPESAAIRSGDNVPCTRVPDSIKPILTADPECLLLRPTARSLIGSPRKDN